ncbi:3-oxoacyl-[acyl-carrier-protein] synthase 3 [Shewanella sp. NFH-SH190041]|uniref:3-oxoacyl-[acyl-carrier-protein] synthase III C-terminal domain-containing protein n=1 Tax=Shewanella sp. NFH-SH190041 TaxID=2950245 RepID=UPI0021C2AA91|nr:3-oxoacyl-[acyl-carrier-protein] synthase III C-terminal domain-containing protein [Shewanella sp. NFH-SH190041]BDM65567.1 3-oxoacyl-[acyl-carrier-protein] synthase 3 [Shewanella sp. NFH-SH190041]
MALKFAPAELSVLGSGFSLPGEAVSTPKLLDALQRLCPDPRLKRRAAALVSRLGIESRHLCRRLDMARSVPTPSGVTLAQQALAVALQQAALPATELEYLLTHTCTPQTQVPPNAAWLAEVLDYPGPYLELRQACTGFANALQIVSAMALASDRPMAVAAMETGSVYFDISPQFIDAGQLVNYVQMGDGAAAVVLAARRPQTPWLSDMYLGHMGNGKAPGFYLSGGAADVGEGQMARFHHDAQSVRSIGPALFKAGLSAVLARGYCLDDFRFILPHQANGHIDTQLAAALAIAPERIINDAKSLGNLGSAAIWMSLARLRERGQLRPGDRVLVLGAEATKYLYGGFVYHHL